jgi:hypothetical protein
VCGLSDAAGLIRRVGSESGGGRRRAAAGLAGESLSMAPELGSARERHLLAARGAAKLTRAAVTAEKRRRGSVEVTKSCDGFRALRCTRTTTSNVGEILTSRRRTWTASRRRDNGDGGESMAAVGS